MTAFRALVGLLGAVVSVGLGACADPYAREDRGGEAAAATRHDEARRQPRGDDRVPPREAADQRPHGEHWSSDPTDVVRAFCLEFVNWSWRTTQRQQKRLAALAAGELRRQYLASAAIAKLERRLGGDRPAMHGAVVAIELDGRGTRRRALCVARQEQLQNGRGELAGRRYAVYLAALASYAGRWAITRWEPQL